MKKLLLALVLLFAPSLAQAQCNGIFPANTVCGTIAGGIPSQVPFSGFSTGINSITTQVFASNGTYTPAIGMVFVDAQCVGGGGAGGGVPTTAAGHNSGGGGGAAAGYARGIFSAATIGVSKAVVVGAGGAGITGATGNNGAQTTFGGALLVANGGAGGPVGLDQTSSIQGGAGGGTATTSSTVGAGITIIGQAGWDGWAFASLSQGGGGGSSFFGGGGTVAMTTASTINGVGAAGPGSAGSGAAAGASQVTTSPGGSGATGICIMVEYIH